MNEAERLEAAITKLETLRLMSTPPLRLGVAKIGWQVSEEVWHGSGRVEIEGVTSDGDGIGSFRNPRDADLIVTLHRTIDAQLAILRAALIVATPEPGFMHSFDTGPGSTVGLGLALADAILGGES